MKNRLYFFIVISSLLFLPTQSFSQNILDELKKAADQIQKDLGKTNSKPQGDPKSKTDINPQQPAVSTPQKKTDDKATIPTNQIVNKPSSTLGNFTLFGVKLGDPITSVKFGDKSFDKSKLIGNSPNNSWLYPGAHITFIPQTKNDYFDNYFISYSPISKKIEGIFGRSKKVYKDENECLKESKDNFKFVAQRNINDNKGVRFQEETSDFYKLTNDMVYFYLNSQFGITGRRVYIYNYCNISKSDHNWLILERDDREL